MDLPIGLNCGRICGGIGFWPVRRRPFSPDDGAPSLKELAQLRLSPLPNDAADDARRRSEGLLKGRYGGRYQEKNSHDPDYYGYRR